LLQAAPQDFRAEIGEIPLAPNTSPCAARMLATDAARRQAALIAKGKRAAVGEAISIIF
jgi:hypothetical protein